MLGIAFRFLTGRFHGTAWDHHVNEGTVEWPPSPWRLQRALVAAASRLFPSPDPQLLQGLILDTLGSLPSYQLPPTTMGHTRHYMPLGRVDSSSKILDAFVAIGKEADHSDAELVVAWPDAAPSEEQRQLLDRLLPELPYLGRAESWVRARSVELPRDTDLDAVPSTDGDVRLQVLQGPTDFQTWRERALALQPTSKKHLPDDRWAALTISTGEILRRKWSSAPGSTTAAYAIRSQPRSRRVNRPPRAAPSSAWFQLSGKVLPKVEETVRVGAMVRAGLMGCARRLLGEHAIPEQLHGRGADGRPLQGHFHAFFLPVDRDGDGRVDHVLVHARDGLFPEARSVLEAFRWFMGPGGHEVHATLLDIGDDIPDCPLLSASVQWTSQTPFVLPRHPKTRAGGQPRLDASGRWVEGPAWQLRSLLSQLDFPEPAALDSEDGQHCPGVVVRGRSIPWYRFRRERLRGGGARGSRQGHGFVVRFDRPVRGPIALGYASHVGLGQFAPRGA